MRPPPRWVRRVLLAPGAVLLLLLLIATIPVWIIVMAALAPLVPGRLRPLRLLWIVLVYAVLETTALVTMGALWVGSGFGVWMQSPPFQRAHYRLAGWFLRTLFGQGEWALRTHIDVSGPTPDSVPPGRPLIVLCRHAGPGDSFILANALINQYAREPRIVLKDTLQWDPAIDVLLNRLPSRFITAGPGHANEAAIADLAGNLDSNDALVIFPEGGNFTPRRWYRAIERLRALGMYRMARRAAAMPNVLAPRPGGVLAALDAAGQADVLLVAHTGLDHLLTVGDVWRELPMDKTIVMRWWLEPRAGIPTGRQERIDWLYDRWARVDEWIDDNRPAAAPSAWVMVRRRARRNRGGPAGDVAAHPVASGPDGAVAGPDGAVAGPDGAVAGPDGAVAGPDAGPFAPPDAAPGPDSDAAVRREPGAR